jgi:hypothetical protein
MLLGLLQIMAATVSLYFLVETGMSRLTVGGLAVTCILTAASAFLFGGRRREP